MTRIYDHYELPEEKERLHLRAVRLEWATIAVFVVTIALMAVTLGQSQAMKAAWTEDFLSLVPPIAFLVADRLRDRGPNERFPYGYHRSVAIGFLAAALALLALGGYILADSLTRLVTGERPPIGLVEIAGWQVWLGWPMIAVLAVTAVPAVVLGRMKIRLARELRDKVLYADAEMNRADWMTSGAAILGVLGIGAGLWWADAVAAAVISADIVRDGLRTTRTAVTNLMDSRPTPATGHGTDPVPEKLVGIARTEPWVLDAWVRLREEGHVLVGEVLVVPRPDTEGITGRLERLGARLRESDWRVHDIVVAPVARIERQ
ncbi:cation transporter [Actinorugispora endophytica]|uniref:Cation diffusion facilitator family transporter n=1 Tax=Actinorugispora endophytica TaxID=1605990 RepID=A0A4R6UZ04_9ACTN|nr:cation transporter [Actinorugispora endophytica]TDQ51556.1 cation diffusion facilitator family transporter [Actinorugispora endophytica]